MKSIYNYRTFNTKQVMDAGCGTGLCGPLFKNLSSHLAGIDLSQRMIDRARDRRIYDHLEVMYTTTSRSSIPNIRPPRGHICRIFDHLEVNVRPPRDQYDHLEIINAEYTTTSRSYILNVRPPRGPIYRIYDHLETIYTMYDHLEVIYTEYTTTSRSYTPTREYTTILR